MRVYKIEEIAERVRPIAERYELSKVYLFGSYARGEATEESDVDLLVGAENVHGLKFFGMWDDIEKALEKAADLVTLRLFYYENPNNEFRVRFRKSVERDMMLICDFSAEEPIH